MFKTSPPNDTNVADRPDTARGDRQFSFSHFHTFLFLSRSRQIGLADEAKNIDKMASRFLAAVHAGDVAAARQFLESSSVTIPQNLLIAAVERMVDENANFSPEMVELLLANVPPQIPPLTILRELIRNGHDPHHDVVQMLLPERLDWQTDIPVLFDDALTYGNPDVVAALLERRFDPNGLPVESFRGPFPIVPSRRSLEAMKMIYPRLDEPRKALFRKAMAEALTDLMTTNVADSMAAFEVFDPWFTALFRTFDWPVDEPIPFTDATGEEHRVPLLLHALLFLQDEERDPEDQEYLLVRAAAVALLNKGAKVSTRMLEYFPQIRSTTVIEALVERGARLPTRWHDNMSDALKLVIAYHQLPRGGMTIEELGMDYRPMRKRPSSSSFSSTEGDDQSFSEAERREIVRACSTPLPPGTSGFEMSEKMRRRLREINPGRDPESSTEFKTFRRICDDLLATFAAKDMFVSQKKHRKRMFVR